MTGIDCFRAAQQPNLLQNQSMAIRDCLMQPPSTFFPLRSPPWSTRCLLNLGITSKTTTTHDKKKGNNRAMSSQTSDSSNAAQMLAAIMITQRQTSAQQQLKHWQGEGSEENGWGINNYRQLLEEKCTPWNVSRQVQRQHTTSSWSNSN